MKEESIKNIRTWNKKVRGKERQQNLINCMNSGYVTTTMESKWE